MATINAAVQAVPVPNAATNITEHTTCLVLSFSSITVKRKVSSGEIKERGNPAEGDTDASVEVDADKELVTVSKTLIDSPEFDAIGSARRKLTRELRKLAVPSLFKEGIYRVKFRAVPRIAEMLKKFVAEDQKRVQAFLDVYKERCDETRAKLKGLANLTDYPSLARVQSAFGVEYHWLTFATDERLRQEVSEEFFQEVKAEYETKLQQATDAIILAKRMELQGLVDHLVDVLTPNDDGTKKRFHASTVGKIKEFLENFALTDGAGDAQLELVVNAATNLLNGVDVKSLKTNEALADGTRQSFDLVKKCLDGLVVQAGTRKMSFDIPETGAAPAAPLAETEDEDEDAFAGVQ
jgi:hypothetical protein